MVSGNVCSAVTVVSSPGTEDCVLYAKSTTTYFQIDVRENHGGQGSPASVLGI
jgi:hypothetical protein